MDVVIWIMVGVVALVGVGLLVWECFVGGLMVFCRWVLLFRFLFTVLCLRVRCLG